MEVAEGPLAGAAHLTQAEAQFVYNVEVLSLPTKKAAELAGMSYNMVGKPHIIQAREQARREMRGDIPTKEDVVHGITDAIGRARLFAEPASEIRGWEVINKMLGYDAPKKVDVNFNESVQVAQKQIRSLPSSELVRMLGADDIIDADFYEVRQ